MKYVELVIAFLIAAVGSIAAFVIMICLIPCYIMWKHNGLDICDEWERMKDEYELD